MSSALPPSAMGALGPTPLPPALAEGSWGGLCALAHIAPVLESPSSLLLTQQGLL